MERKCIELIMRVLLFNEHRIDRLWSLVHAYFERILMAATDSQDSRHGHGFTFVIERIIVAIVRLMSNKRLMARPLVGKMLLSSLKLFSLLPDTLRVRWSARTVKGLYIMLVENAMYIQGAEHWSIVFDLLLWNAKARLQIPLLWKILVHLVEILLKLDGLPKKYLLLHERRPCTRAARSSLVPRPPPGLAADIPSAGVLNSTSCKKSW